MYGFVYLWHDRLSNRFYLGSHIGSEDDGYIGSSKWLKSAYKKRPDTFRRRIIERIYEKSRKAVHEAEQRWINMIKPSELATSESVVGGTCRYYNMKLHAAGGNGSANKGRTKRSWRKGVTAEMLELRRSGAFCLLCDKPKFAKMVGNRHSLSSRQKMSVSKMGVPLKARRTHTKKPWNFGKKLGPSPQKGTFRTERNKTCLRCESPFFDGGKSNRRKYCSPSCGQIRDGSLGAQNGRKSADKQRARVTGRKREYQPDGSWKWMYPQ